MVVVCFSQSRTTYLCSVGHDLPLSGWGKAPMPLDVECEAGRVLFATGDFNATDQKEVDVKAAHSHSYYPSYRKITPELWSLSCPHCSAKCKLTPVDSKAKEGGFKRCSAALLRYWPHCPTDNKPPCHGGIHLYLHKTSFNLS